MKIVVTNGGHFVNKGDAGILSGTLHGLRETFEDCKITLISHVPETDEGRWPNIRVLPSQVSSRRRPGSKPHKILRFFGEVFTIWLWAILSRVMGHSVKIRQSEAKQKALDAYWEADLIWCRGGHFIVGHSTQAFATFDLLVHLHQSYMGVILGKPTVFSGGSFGPFRTWLQRLLVRYVMNRALLITCREEYSAQCVRELGVSSPPIQVTADPAFLLKPVSPDHALQLLQKEGLASRRRPWIGISVRRFDFASDRYGGITEEEYLTAMVQVADYWIEQHHATVAFLPQVTGHAVHDGDDTIIARQVMKGLRNKENVCLLASHYTPEELSALYGTLDLVIGTRMHANIFAMLHNVPVVAIAYAAKTSGIMEMMNLSDWVVNMHEITAERLIFLSEDCWGNRESLREQIGEGIVRLQERARQDARLAAKLLRASMAR